MKSITHPICSAFLVAVAYSIATGSSALSQELSWIRVGEKGHRFIHAESNEEFIPWGVNYDHDPSGRLLEDYWHDEWATIEADLEEIKALGANVIRIHLQLGKFMETANQPNEKSLQRLKKLVRLAESKHLYLDVTGLGCYHKQDIPPWYDKLDEAARWKTQAHFWAAVAKTCADSPAIFCYDLMNEPVVPGGDKPRKDWLGPGFGDKHFVQFISLNRAGRDRTEIANAWIETLVAAIRKHDKKHMITVGLVPWSLAGRGISSGFVPEKIHQPLDFIAMHIYPESGKLEEALETVKGFDVGKPIVIEETFPLKCKPDELISFIDQSKPTACGWISFYWGKPAAELRESKTIAASITANWLDKFQEHGPKILAD